MTKSLYKAIVVLFIVCCSCATDTEEVRLRLFGLILPGKTTSNNNVVAKYIWEGGGQLREISKVNVDLNDNIITITPYGLIDYNLLPTDDIFWQTGFVSLGILPIGSYTIKLVGETFTYYDTLNVPVDACDSLFQFHVTVISQETNEAIPDLPLMLLQLSSMDTLRDTTDLSGIARFTYHDFGVDSLVYELKLDIYFVGGFLYFSQTVAKLGIPEVITVGVR